VIAVTGAAGHVGSHLVRRLAEAGRPVRALVHNPDSARRGGRLSGLDVEVVRADVTRPETLGAALKGASTVVHTVAIAIEKGKGTYEAVNHRGTVNVVDSAEAEGVKRFVNLSQQGAHPDLPFPFLASKGRAQAYVARSALAWTALRPSVIWGSTDEFANTFARLAPLSPLVYPIVGDGSARFQPIWVEDVVTCIVGALDDPGTIGLELELGGPEILTLEEIERRTLDAIGAHRLLVRVPIPIMRGVVALMEALLPSPPVTRSLLDLLAVDNVPSANAVRRFVSEPRSFTAENVGPYMREFRVADTLRRFLGR
jgi:NADH dehydrogenase